MKGSYIFVIAEQTYQTINVDSMNRLIGLDNGGHDSDNDCSSVKLVSSLVSNTFDAYLGCNGKASLCRGGPLPSLRWWST